MELTSTSNAKVKYWQKLKEKKYRDQEKLFLIEDEHLVSEALKKNIVKEIITINDNIYNVDTYKVTTQIMKLLSSQVSSSKIIAVCHTIEEKELTGNIIILDNIQDPGNLGTIIRSAVAFNIDTIILGNGCVDLYNEKVLRAAEGMHLNINIFNDDLNTIIPTLKEQNYQVIGTKLSNGLELSEFKPKEKYALIMGNEGSGVDESILNMCDDYVYIKMNKQCESLNVGVATSIILYGFHKNL